MLRLEDIGEKRKSIVATFVTAIDPAVRDEAFFRSFFHNLSEKNQNPVEHVRDVRDSQKFESEIVVFVMDDLRVIDSSLKGSDSPRNLIPDLLARRLEGVF